MAHVIFNFGNISQATWIDRKDIKQIIVKNANSAEVLLTNGEALTEGAATPSEVTREQIKPVIENKRLESSKDLEVFTTGFNTYLVRNPDKGSEYEIKPKFDYLFCTCSDYANQSIAFESKEVTCKHTLAVLGYLGFSSLKDYQGYGNDFIIAILENQKETELEYLELENDKDFLK